MSAKLLRDDVATEMHASDSCTMIHQRKKVEIDRSNIKHVLGLLNIIILLSHMSDTESVFYMNTMF